MFWFGFALGVVLAGAVAYCVGRLQGVDAERLRVATIFGHAFQRVASPSLRIVNGAVLRDYDVDRMDALLQETSRPVSLDRWRNTPHRSKPPLTRA